MCQKVYFYFIGSQEPQSRLLDFWPSQPQPLFTVETLFGPHNCGPRPMETPSIIMTTNLRYDPFQPQTTQSKVNLVEIMRPQILLALGTTTTQKKKHTHTHNTTQHTNWNENNFIETLKRKSNKDKRKKNLVRMTYFPNYSFFFF